MRRLRLVARQVALMSMTLSGVLCLQAAISLPCFSAGTSGINTGEGKSARPSTVSLPVSTKTIAGDAFLKECIETVHQLGDYSADSGVLTHHGHKDSFETCHFFFKQPNQIRVEVVKAGIKSGSVLVRDQQGKITAKPGSLLKFKKLDLTPESALVKSANGFSMLEADYGSLLGNAQKTVTNSQNKCVVTADTIEYVPTHGRVRVMELQSAPSNSVSERIFISADNKLPVEWTIYKGGTVFSTCAWRNQKLNTGMSDTLFSLKKQQKQ